MAGPPIVLPYVFTPNTIADATQVNANFTTLVNAINGQSFSLASLVTTSMTTSGSGTANQVALQNDINSLITAGGGILYIPYGSYTITGSVQVNGVEGDPRSR